VSLVLGELAAVLVTDDKRFKQGLGDAKTRFAGFGGKLKVAAAAIGVAAAAALAAGVVDTLNVDRAQDKLAAQLGGSAQDAARLGQVAGNLYTGAWGDSIGQVNDAVRSVITNIAGMKDASSKDVEGVTASVLDLATTFEVDVGGATRSVGKLLKTGLAPDAQAALDLLTRGFQTGGDEAGDLLDTVSEYSTMFRDVGLDGQQAFGLVSQGLRAGARDADTVADAIKEFAIRAQDGSELSAEGFKALGLSAKDMTATVAAGGDGARQALATTLDKLREIEDPAKRNAAAVALFGTKAEDLGDALFALDLDTAVDELGQVEGAAAKMGDTLNDNAATTLESFKRKAQQALVEKLAQAIPHLEAVGRFLGEHKDVVVPLATGLGILAGVIATIIVATKIWTAVQTAFNIVMALNPVVLIILAVLALVAAIVWLATQTQFFQTVWDNIWGTVGDPVKAVWSWIKNNWPLLLAILTGPIGLAVLFIIRHWDQIKAGATAAKDWIVGKWNALVGFVTGLPARMRAAARGLFDGIKDSFRNAVNWLIDRWNAFQLVIGGGSIMGISIPSITLSTPDIPRLAQGGIIPATPGGRLVVAGEGGKDEAIVPLDKLDKLTTMIRDAIRDTRGGLHVEHLEVKPITDRFRLRDVQDELAWHGTH
jgi:hypothetical protein